MIRKLPPIALTSVLVGSWLVLLGWQPLLKEWRNYSDPGPWFSAKIEVAPERLDPEGNPTILYTKQIDRVLNGAWSAWLQTVDGQTITFFCGGNGRGIYAPAESGTRTYSMRYFLGQNCDVPRVPYRVCAEYIMDYNGRSRFIGPVCSTIVPGTGKERL